MIRFLDLLNSVVKSRFFNALVVAVIAMSAIIMGIETYPRISSEYHALLILLDRFIITFFVFEIALKIIANGKRPWNYFLDPWNIFDFVIVGICLIPSEDTHFFAVLRIVRILRIFRMITVFPKLRLIVGALLKSIPSMGYVVMLIGILFYVYAIVGVFIFGKSDPMHFGDLHHSLVTLFKVLTLEGWTDIMNVHIFGNATVENQQIVSFWPFLYFSSFILIGAMIIMNLFIGVIMNSMEESQLELENEFKTLRHKDQNAEEIYTHILSKLDELNKEIKELKRN